MNINNRPVLRPTQNRLPLQDVSSQQYKTKLTLRPPQHDQENLTVTVSIKKSSTTSRPILTAIRSLKQQYSQDNEQHTDMLISPMVKTTSINVSNVTQIDKKNKSREELEQELFELPDYRQSIYEHLKSVEHIYALKNNFMEYQSDINSAMRTILIDWLIEVADEYKLNDETLFLAVQYIDRFLSKVNITRVKLQLLGTTSMYLAAKYEEMYPPALEEFSFITDNTYETKHILRMEQNIIKMLNFSLSGPTSYVFLQYYLIQLKSIDDNDEYKSLSILSKYLCTLTLLYDCPFSSYCSSLIAASCLLFAIQLFHSNHSLDNLWSNIHIQLTNYTQMDLHQCTLTLAELHSKMYHQEKITSSVLRRYLNSKKHMEMYEKRVREIIHHSKIDLDEDESILDLTLNEFDDDHHMSMDFHR